MLAFDLGFEFHLFIHTEQPGKSSQRRLKLLDG